MTNYYSVKNSPKGDITSFDEKGISTSLNDCDQDERSYLQKIDWFWNQISEEQKSCINDAVRSRTLRQEHSKHCIIGNVLRERNANGTETTGFGFSNITNVIFYDGPSYQGLLQRKLSQQDKKILDDIYYAKIGKMEHQYERANLLAYRYLSEVGNLPQYHHQAL